MPLTPNDSLLNIEISIEKPFKALLVDLGKCYLGVAPDSSTFSNISPRSGLLQQAPPEILTNH